MTHERNAMMPNGVVSTLNEAIRENPLAAGLIGAGVCWMLFSKFKAPALGGVADALKDAAGSIGSAAGSVGAAAGAGGRSLASKASKTGSQLAEAATEFKDRAQDAISALAPSDAPSIVAEAGDTMRAGLRSSVKMGQRYGAAAQQTLRENLDRQPLLLGAIGLAIGAGIASAFASTQIENELMGEQGSAARESLQDLADEAKQFAATRAEEVMDAVQDEAQAQGLTADAAKDAWQNLRHKAKGVAEAAGEAVKNRT
jgi:hypothetical protein